MDIFLKVTAGVLVAAVLCLVLTKQNADLAMLLAMAVCCMVIAAAFSYFAQVLDFARKLIEIGKLDHGLLDVLLKIVGIGLLSQIAGMVCADAGKQSLEKVLQILTTAVILCISIPVLEEMLALIETVLGEV